MKFLNKLIVKISSGGSIIIDYRVEEKEELRLLAYTKIFTYESCVKGIPAFWEEYYQNDLYKKAPGYFGITQENFSTRGFPFSYGIGCYADDVKEIPEGFQLITIPASTWAIFKCVGQIPDAIQKTWRDMYLEGLAGADYEWILDYDIEYFLPGDTTSCDYVCEIWVPVKKRN